MRKRLYRAFWIWDFEKEEQWLNEMAAKGLCLISAGFCRYEFVETLPGEYGVRMQLLEHSLRHPGSEQYIAFLEEMGAEHVGSCKNWAYFRKSKSQGEFELLSDRPSRIRQLQRIERLLIWLGILSSLVGAINLFLYILHRESSNLIGLVNLLIGILCLSGLWRLHRKTKRLRQEQQLFEE